MTIDKPKHKPSDEYHFSVPYDVETVRYMLEKTKRRWVKMNFETIIEGRSVQFEIRRSYFFMIPFRTTIISGEIRYHTENESQLFFSVDVGFRALTKMGLVVFKGVGIVGAIVIIFQQRWNDLPGILLWLGWIRFMEWHQLRTPRRGAFHLMEGLLELS